MARTSTFWVIPLLLLCRLAPASPQGTEDFAARIAAAPKTHPRLFMDPVAAAAIEQRIGADPMLSRVMAHVKACADAIVQAEPVTRKKVGRRLLAARCEL